MGQIRVILTTDPGGTAGTWVTFGVVLHTRGIEELDGVGVDGADGFGLGHDGDLWGMWEQESSMFLKPRPPGPVSMPN